ncbi:MAG: NAD(P)-dependent alcohol dehydrogenase, partial [SAR202 cluster bacterium]|nr:NAD(P)-dependent alcohol dehydrogenase [SAR202 cluster bacterium]
MKAIVYCKYGSPDVLKLEEVEKPTPADDEVLIKIHAASVNSWDWDLLRGKPLLARVTAGGLRRPKNHILGGDIAGQVEAVGSNAKRFQPGDEVFGEMSLRFISVGWGGFAEYVCARETSMMVKPPGMTFEEAASVPQVGALALAGLRFNGQIQPAQKFLMNGAGGGVGTFAVQMAKTFGAEVTGVDSAEKLDMLRSIGADHV